MYDFLFLVKMVMATALTRAIAIIDNIITPVGTWGDVSKVWFTCDCVGSGVVVGVDVGDSVVVDELVTVTTIPIGWNDRYPVYPSPSCQPIVMPYLPGLEAEN